MRRALLTTITMIVTLLLCPSVAESKPGRYATLDERTVARTIETSPHDYIAAVIQVATSCTMVCDGWCFDRVRIVEVIAQAPPPTEQVSVGGEFHLFSGAEGESNASSIGARFLVMAEPRGESSCPDKRYFASLLGPADAPSVKSLRQAFATVP
jgi:hypothetical protein